MAKRQTSHVPSARRPPPGAAIANRLLAALASEEYARLSPDIDIVPFPLKEILHKPGEAIRHVYFPSSGFASVLTVLEDGGMVEVATIGREGMVGISAVLDVGPSPSTALVQAESDACYRINTESFRDEMSRNGHFARLVTRYAHALVGVIMQSTACNAVHSVEQRLARWLLLAHDRVERDDFPLTQEFVAMMLGTTRPTVTIVAGVLQRAGLITYHRGHVTIFDRERLEAASCECYRVTTQLLKGVFAAKAR